MSRPIHKIFDPNNLDKFIDSVAEILQIGGASGSKFFNCVINGSLYLVKMSLYTKSYSEEKGIKNEKMSSGFDVEIKLLTLLKDKIINNNLSWCILEILDYEIYNDITKLVPSTKKCDQLITQELKMGHHKDIIQNTFCVYKDFIDSGVAYNKLSFIILETCEMTLYEFLNKYIDTSPMHLEMIKSIIFMLIYTVYVIKQVFPSFYHGDLHLGNVMLIFDPEFKYVPGNPKYIKAWVDNKPHYLPYFGIIVKIIDFDRASIPDEGIIPFLYDSRISGTFVFKENDFIKLFHSIFIAYPRASLDNMLEQLQPNKYYVNYNPDFLRRNASKLFNELQMLKVKLFDDYRLNVARDDQIYKEFANVNDFTKSK